MDKQTIVPDESLGFWIYRIYAQASSRLRRTFQAHGYDCTPEQWGVMTRLRDEEGMNQSQLGERTFKDRHNITRILDLLEKRGGSSGGRTRVTGGRTAFSLRKRERKQRRS